MTTKGRYPIIISLNLAQYTRLEEIQTAYEQKYHKKLTKPHILMTGLETIKGGLDKDA